MLPPQVPLKVADDSAIAVLRNRPFLLLWFSQLATQVGGNMVIYGLTVLVLLLTGSSSLVALVFLTFLTPAVLFSALAGVYVDRFDRRSMLVATSLLRAIAFLAMAVFHTNVVVILVLSAVVAIASTFFAPAELSMIPLLVPRAQLTAANSIFTLTLNAAFALGFALLGPIVATVAGPTFLIIVVSALYFVSAAICATLPPAPPTHRDGKALAEAGEALGSVVEQFREGIAYVRSHRIVFWALVYLGISASIIGVLGVLGPKFATQVLGLETTGWGVVVLPLGIGVVAGVLLVNVTSAMLPRRRVIEAGLVGLGICLVLITLAQPISGLLKHLNDVQPVVDASAFASVLAVVMAIAFIAGIAYAAIAIPSQTELQAEIPEEVRGRVFGILNMLVSAGSFVPIIVVGAFADTVGTAPVVMVAASIVGLTGVASIVLRGRPESPPPGAAGFEDVGGGPSPEEP